MPEEEEKAGRRALERGRKKKERGIRKKKPARQTGCRWRKEKGRKEEKRKKKERKVKKENKEKEKKRKEKEREKYKRRGRKFGAEIDGRGREAKRDGGPGTTTADADAEPRRRHPVVICTPHVAVKSLV